MKIYFSPVYSCRVHFSQPIMMDAAVCNVAQLVNLIELHSGVHYKDYSDTELSVHYLQALQKMDSEHKENVLHDSLSKDPLSTAKACLAWRDMLILAGWKPDMQPSARIKALALAEPYFRVKTLADRIMALPDLISTSDLAKRLEIEVQYNENLMHPAIRAIIQSLRQNGATITYPVVQDIPSECNLNSIRHWVSDSSVGIPELKLLDDSLEILKFKDRKSILRYISSLEEESVKQCLWISNHGADIDRALSRAGKSTSGSTSECALPSIVQLLPLGLSLFISPVDINKLVAWLRTSRSPLPGVRLSIAKVILNAGGWDKEEIDNAVIRYLENHPDADEKAIRGALKKFLFIPALYDNKLKGQEDKDGNNGNKIENHDDVAVKPLKKFIKDLKEWALEARRQEYQHELYSQFDKLIERISTVELLLEYHNGDTIDVDTLSQWVNLSSEASGYEQYTAHCQGPIVIDCPADMVGNQDCCHWMGFSNHNQGQRSYAFLSSIERKSLKDSGCELYDEDKEIAANRIVSLWPLFHSSHLIIYEMEDKERDEIRSVISQQLLSLPETERQKITTEMRKVSCQTANYTIENFDIPDTKHIIINNGSGLSWRSLESYSSIYLLVQYPFEYVMKYGLNLEPSADDLVHVSKSIGKVAHYVIQGLFIPGRKPVQIQEHFKTDYENLLAEALQRKGMILLLPENEIELVRLKNNLPKSIKSLLEIYKANGFVTIAFEENIEGGLTLKEGHIMQGDLDLHVVDNMGDHAVIDLKWTSKPKKYESMVNDERALQLDIYHTLLAARHQRVKSSFYVMPCNLMYTNFDIKGKAVENISRNHTVTEMIDRMVNSYLYRRNQIEKGQIEFADGEKLGDFDYGRDSKDKKRINPLYPLETTNSRKSSNIFSDYKCFYNLGQS